MGRVVNGRPFADRHVHHCTTNTHRHCIEQDASHIKCAYIEKGLPAKGFCQVLQDHPFFKYVMDEIPMIMFRLCSQALKPTPMAYGDMAFQDWQPASKQVGG
eukprot:6322811-Amphidinium_carterae.1